MPVGHLYVFFEEISIYVFCPFLTGLFVFVIELHEMFVYFGISALVNHIICKYFFPVHGLSFGLFKVSFAVQIL